MEALPDYEKDGSLYILEKAIEETYLLQLVKTQP